MAKRRILIADDEEDFLKAITIRLKSAGYETAVARNGLEVQKECEKEKPDLIVLDIMMPKMDGFEVLRKLKENESLKDIPVIYLTAGEFDISKELDILSMAQDFMLKTVDSDKIVERINRILS
ncbi:two-component system response regulator [candidate division KSB1 bacterium]|nr:MAG: two-component system response regulator [candidate division KSB1 bacterium]